MSNTQLVVHIREREALPVRAIPFVTGYALPPYEVAEQFARLVERHFKRLKNLCAYRLVGDNQTQVTIAEWKEIKGKFQLLAEEINPNFDDLTLAHREWDSQTVGLLPSGVFVWLKEFEREWDADEERCGNDPSALSLAPDLDQSTLRQVMMGFDECRPLEASQDNSANTPKDHRPQQQQPWQEEKILQAIKDAGYPPTELPIAIRGMSGVKSVVREKLNFSATVFDKAWERLRANGRISDAK